MRRGCRPLRPSRLGGLFVRGLIDGSARHREFAAIRQSDIEKLPTVRSRSQRVYDGTHLVTWLDAVLFPTVLYGLADCLHLQRIFNRLSVLIDHDVEPGMRIGPFQLLDSAIQRDRLVAIEHRE